MPCEPFDIFKQYTQNFLDDIYAQTSPMSTFNTLIPKATYPHGVGLNRSVFTMGRSLPTTNTPEFERVAFTEGEAYVGTCNTTYNDVPVGFYERNYSPEKFGWKGPLICSDDLIYSWQIGSFIPAYISAMGKNTMWTINNRFKAIYDHMVPKYSVEAGEVVLSEPGTGLPGQAPVLTLDRSFCELTQDHLDQIAQLLINEGADIEPHSDGWIDYGEDGPLFTLDVSLLMSKRLFLNNAELRQDIRFAYESKGEMSPLIKRLFSSRRLGNFRHLVNAFPSRYNYNGTAYVEVDTWIVDPDATKGEPVKLNPAWLSAPYEAARVLSPYVFTSEVVAPVNSAGGLSWPPKSYTGEWMFKTGGRQISEDPDCYDPLDKLGRHFAEYAHAPRPVKPRYGVLMIYRRCLAEAECVTCGGT